MHDFELSINIHIRDIQAGGGSGLQLSESQRITAKGFLEVAAILGKFHELAEKLKAQNAGG